MKNTGKILLLVCFIFLLLSLFACGEDNVYTPHITLSEKSVTFGQIGESLRIEASTDRVLHSDEVSWYSSDTTVAVCEDGVITAKGWGICVIRATVNRTNSATCVVTVDDANPTITLSLNDYDFHAIGETVSITAYNAQNYDISPILQWASSNTSVATVEDGVIEAVGYGTSLITATAKNGNVGMCIVSTVDPTVPSVDFEEIGKDEIILLDSIGDETQLTADIFLDDKTKITWISSNTDVVTCENGLLRAVSKGTAVVIAATEKGATAARMVKVEGGDEFTMPDEASAIIRLDTQNIGKTIKYFDANTDELIAAFIITGIRVECQIYENTGVLYVTPYFTSVKVYDKNGLDATTAYDAQMKLYRENNEFCEQYRCRFIDSKVGDEVECESAVFGVSNFGSPRPFYFVIVPIIES